MVKESGFPVECCGKPMVELVAGTVDVAWEKHVSVYEVKDGVVTVTVVEVEHPMAPEHYIEWISLQTGKGNQRKVLKPGQKPNVTFYIGKDEKLEAIYAYCNIHGLWKK